MAANVSGIRRSSVVWLTLLASACAGASGKAHDATPVVAFVHAAVIPMDHEGLDRDQTVLVRGAMIVAVGPSASVAIPKGATVIDAGGAYLLPGLIDAHVHVESNAFRQAFGISTNDSIPFERVLLPYLAHGVTSVAILTGSPDLLAVRDRAPVEFCLGTRTLNNIAETANTIAK